MIGLDLLEPYHFEFFRNAVLVSVLAGAVCGLIGVYVVLRGMSSINRNTVTGDGGLGGGVYAAAASFLVLRDRSTVRDNMVVGIGGRGGGILDEFSTINGAPCTARGNEHVFANSPRNCAGI